MTEEQIEKIARVAHMVNRAYCQSIGDMSQPTWEEAPDWQRKSAIKGVLFHQENPGALPSQSHDSWLAEKQADGWARQGSRKEGAPMLLAL